MNFARGRLPRISRPCPGEAIREAASDWADRAAAVRSRVLLADQASSRRGHQPRLRASSTTCTAREQHLAEGGLPEPEAPPTRQASRHVRAGAPFYMLVDFAASVSEPTGWASRQQPWAAVWPMPGSARTASCCRVTTANRSWTHSSTPGSLRPAAAPSPMSW